MTPIRCERVVDGDTVSVLVSLDPADVMVELTAREVTVTLSSQEAVRLGFALVDASGVSS